MSIENAILELAAAIRYAADKTAGGTGKITTLIENVSGSGSIDYRDEVEKAVTQVETDAKAAQQKAMDKVSTGKAEIAAALARAKEESDQKAADFQKKIDADKAAAQAQVDAINNPLDAAPLDWDKDVRPALLAVGKDRDALVKLMGKYEVPKGGKAPVEKWADLLAEANAIVAARG